VLSCLLSVSVVCGAEEASLDKISVSGQGEVSAAPDMATVNTGVTTQAETAREALDANNTAMEKIVGVLKEHHVAEKDIQTSNFSVSPVYKRDPRGRTQPEVTGYRVQNQVRVHVRNLPDLGEVLDALVSAGSNQVSGISFGVDDPTGILNQARSRAVADAKSRAGVYAQAAGVKVGKLRQISETPVAIPQPRMLGFAEARGASAVPVQPGELEFRVTVHLVFDIDE
jgi:uncharacterized protein YggE